MSGLAIEFESKVAVFLEKEQYVLKKSKITDKRKTGQSWRKTYKKQGKFSDFFKKYTHLGATIAPKKGLEQALIMFSKRNRSREPMEKTSPFALL